MGKIVPKRGAPGNKLKQPTALNSNNLNGKILFSRKQLAKIVIITITLTTVTSATITAAEALNQYQNLQRE